MLRIAINTLLAELKGGKMLTVTALCEGEAAKLGRRLHVWEHFVIGLFASSINPAATMRRWQATKLRALRFPAPAFRVTLEAKPRAAQNPMI